MFIDNFTQNIISFIFSHSWNLLLTILWIKIALRCYTLALRSCAICYRLLHPWLNTLLCHLIWITISSWWSSSDSIVWRRGHLLIRLLIIWLLLVLRVWIGSILLLILLLGVELLLLGYLLIILSYGLNTLWITCLRLLVYLIILVNILQTARNNLLLVII